MIIHRSVAEETCRADCFEAYRFIQSTLNQKLEEAGERLRVDGDRCVAIGGSAGGTLVVQLVSFRS